MNNSNKTLRYIALFGNPIYILWIIYNGIDEGFKATLVQKSSYIGILILLMINFFLLYKKS